MSLDEEMDTSDSDVPEDFGTHIMCPFVMRPAITDRMRNAGTVAATLEALLGRPTRQIDLISFRLIVFANVFPPINRSKKRCRNANLLAYESHRDVILPMLARIDISSQVINLAINASPNAKRMQTLMHVLDLDVSSGKHGGRRSPPKWTVSGQHQIGACAPESFALPTQRYPRRSEPAFFEEK
jgi:hypothetical protein